ncbi:MAG TPA: biotin carboxylase N-terminal domain-containing protein [Caulobacteraceae bacterium]|nr:biotin carboxylase N-terminal domain-containing protein [Caulobacteraceae bacterium]
MIGSLLIANRGEVARRIMRTARRMGVRTVAVYSEADAGAAHVREADEAVLIGPPAAALSYLDGAKIIAAAKRAGADAVHPGYGFLSENADFAQAVIAAGLLWVGPPPAAIRAMGLKDAAKRLMAGAGVPVTPGYLGEDQDVAVLAREAAAIGWPVMIKAIAGGGGRGMRKVDGAADFEAALTSARREALAAFGDDRVLLEKAIARPRHIEVQVFGDAAGDVVHMFERDCSLQRRHQKVIEEAPAPGMTAEVRAAVCDAAVRAAKAVAYEGAGTVEFIADASDGLRADRIWFMEMNTRLQVEHPVTEAVTGLDLVEWQLRVASGEPLPLAQDQIAMSGHAIEARLYAEDPASGFMPSSGAVRAFVVPESVRVDSAVEWGDRVPPYYDAMIAKLIAHGPDRATAIETLTNACARLQVWPVKTNAGFLNRLLQEPAVRVGDVETDLIERRPDLTVRPAPDAEILRSAAFAFSLPGGAVADSSPWLNLTGFRSNVSKPAALVRLESDGIGYAVDLLASPPAEGARRVLRATGVDGHAIVFENGDVYDFVRPGAVGNAVGEGGDGAIRAPMPGRIVAVAVKAGEAVEPGAPLVTLEAMKMEHVLVAPFEGTVIEVAATVGQQVGEGVLLARVEAKP